MNLFDFVSFLVLCQYSVLTYAQISKKFFRYDYTYFDSTKSFYKIHTIHRTWQDAKKTCALEGSFLLYPEDQNEADVVTDFLNRTQPFLWVYIGGAALLAKGVYETINGVPVNTLYHNWGPGEPNDGNLQDCMVLRREGTLYDEDCSNQYPFICKKSLSSLEWNQLCHMPNTDYEYNANIGRCYKFHQRPKIWSDAYATCSAEQSYLAVIDSHQEADVLASLTAKALMHYIDSDGDYVRGAVHLGFYKGDEGWSTIKGVPLSDSGYSEWAWGYGLDFDRPEKCGSMFYNGKLNDVKCEQKGFFICEHDVDVLSTTFDKRFGVDEGAQVEEVVKTTIKPPLPYFYGSRQ